MNVESSSSDDSFLPQEHLLRERIKLRVTFKFADLDRYEYREVDIYHYGHVSGLEDIRYP